MDYMEKFEYTHVMMEREYLRAWKIFKEETAKIFPAFVRQIRTETSNLEG
jgi:hypothetical protein